MSFFRKPTPLPVQEGGTGSPYYDYGYAIIGNGYGAMLELTPSTSGNVMTSNGTTWTSAPATGVTKDANGNITVNAVYTGFTNVAAAGTTTVLTAASTPNFVVTGSGGQTYQLPNATTLPNGAFFTFNNNQSSGTIVVTNNSGTTIATVQSGGFVSIVLLSNSIAAGSWDYHFQAPSSVLWSTNTFTYGGSMSALSFTSTNDSTINGVRVGKGSGSISGNTAVGTSALNSNTTGDLLVGVGYQALYSNTTGGRSVALGKGALYNNTTGYSNIGIGYGTGVNVTSGNANTLVGNDYAGSWGASGEAITTGNANSFFGTGSGRVVSTGSNNSIIGSYSGNQNNLDIRTSSNNSVISNGAGTLNFYADGASNFAHFNGAFANNNCYGTSLQSFDGLTLGSVGVWTNVWNIPLGVIGLLAFNIGYGSYGGGALFFVCYGNSGALTPAMFTICTTIGDQAGYNFAFRISGTYFQVQNNTNSVAFVPRLNFINMT